MKYLWLFTFIFFLNIGSIATFLQHTYLGANKQVDKEKKLITNAVIVKQN